MNIAIILYCAIFKLCWKYFKFFTTYKFNTNSASYC